MADSRHFAKVRLRIRHPRSPLSYRKNSHLGAGRRVTGWGGGPSELRGVGALSAPSLDVLPIYIPGNSLQSRD